MIQLHATRKLFERLPLDDYQALPATPRSQWLFDQPALETSALSGWHGNLITLQRRNCVLMVHDTTRFPVVLPALTKPDYRELNDHFVDGFMNTLLKCGAEEPELNAARQNLRPLQVDTLGNRSVLGTLNQMKGDLEHLLWHDNINIADLMGYSLGAWLADSPCSVKGRGYLWPQKAMFELLATMPTGTSPGALPIEAAELPDNVVSMQGFRRRH